MYQEEARLHLFITYTIGWVNLYQKFEIEKYTICGKLILPTQKMERHLKKIFLGTTGLRICMDL